MKKNFLAKLGHFAVVGALLFNSFGVAFVHADDVNPDPTTISFVHSQYTVSELTLADGGEWSTGIAAIKYTGPALAEGDVINVTVSVDTDNSTAIQDKDFKFTEVTDSFTPTVSTIYLPITIISNDQIENDRTVVLKNNISASTFTLTIQDDDLVAPTFTSGNASFTENVGNFVGATAPFTNNDSNTLDFHFEISGTASNSDYVIGTTSQKIDGSEITDIENSVELDNGTGIIRNIGANEKRRFLFQPVDDTEVEGEETVIITLTYATDNEGKIYHFPNISYTTTIQDNDTNYFGFETSSSTIAEGNEATTTATVRIVADQVSDVDHKLKIKISDLSSATKTEDFVRSTDTSNSFFVTIPAGATSTEFDVLINGDTTQENDESIIFNVYEYEDYSNFEVNENNIHSLTIVNDDGPTGGSTNTAPTVVGQGIPDMDVVASYGDMISSTTLSSYFTDLDGDNLTFTATSSDPNNITTVMDNGDLVILSSNTNLTQTNVTVTADDGNGGTVEDTFVVNVIGNEVSFDIASDDVNEGDGTYTVHLHSLKAARDSGAGAPEGEIGNSTVIVYFQVNNDSTATENSDYTISADVSNSGAGNYYVVEVPINSTGTSFDININDDTDVESTESVSLSLIQGENTAYVNANADTFVLSIADNDNLAPTVVADQNALLVDRTISVNEQFAINLTTLFTDSDNTAAELQYSILTGDNSGVVTTTLDHNTDGDFIATFTGLSAGTTTIKLGVKDPTHTYVYADPFMLTVTETTNGGGNTGGNDNQTPVVDTVIPTQHLDLYTTPTTTIDNATLVSLFTDPDNERVTLSITGNSDDSVVSTTHDGEFSSLTLTGLSVGTSTIELTGTDPHGATVTSSFDVVVIDSTPTNGENHAPTPSETPLEDQYDIDLAETDTTTVDLASAFYDEDEDVLTYQLLGNSNPSVVTVTIEDGTMTLVGSTVGTSTVYITVSDGNGGSYNDSFLVTVSDSSTTDTTDNSGSTGGSSSSSGGGGGFFPNTPPTAAFTTGQEVTIAVNTEVTFDASDSVDKEGDIQFYFWNFGDGSDEEYYTVPTVVHTYTETGDYTLAVRVRDTHYAESTAEVTVHVVEGNTPATGTETEQNGSSANGSTPTEEPTTETGSTPTEETGTTPETTSPTTGTETTAPTTGEQTTESQTQETTDNTEDTPEPTNTDTEQGTGDEQTNEAPATEEDQGLPTWIRILFGSGAVAAVAGAGVAINRARRTL